MTVEDREESITLMEPILISSTSKHRAELADLALELATESAAFKSSLPLPIVSALADLVRSMNCYYSNLIEGHDTHPIDIERALNDDYSENAEKRNLQLEAKAHITVQKWIDDGGMTDTAIAAPTIQEIHYRFYNHVPAELLFVENPETGEKNPIIPGQYRVHDVQVGRHVAISPGAISRFMTRFEEAFNKLGRVDAILSTAAAHHRLLWIHPFVDGNGRVARLMTHAMLLQALDTGAIWSAARGLARNDVKYKDKLAACDMNKRNSLDGHGTLSEETLAEFSKFFLTTCLDQVKFMRSLVEPNKLQSRIGKWAIEQIEEGTLPSHCDKVLEAIMYKGKLPRSEVAEIIGLTERQARRVTSALSEAGVLVSNSQRAPFKLAFPARLAGSWMPGLFPDKAP